MTKKKILFIMPTLGGGGAERVVCNIANNLPLDRFEVIVYVLRNEENNYVDTLASHVNVHVAGLEGRIRFKIFSIIKDIKKRFNPDIIFSGYAEVSLMLAPFIPFYKNIYWIARQTNTFSEMPSTKLKDLFFKKFYSNFNVIIAQCNEMKQEMVDIVKISSEKIQVINNPVDTDWIDTKLEQYGVVVDLPKDKINLVASGRIVYQKGFDLLLKSFATIEDKKKYHLTIIGKKFEDETLVGSYDDLVRIIKQCKLQEYVSIVPFQSNIHKWLQVADVFILSSRFEGFPNILLEALYCGTPAITNNCPGGIKEIITEENGVLMQIEKVGDLKASLLEIEKKNFDKYKIKNNIKERYGVDVIMKQYINLFDKIVKA